MRRKLAGLVALTLALVAIPAAIPAEPVAASLGPAYRDAHAGLQAGAVVVMSSGDISPATNVDKNDDYATSEIIFRAQPDLALTLGDNQYEQGSGEMFHSAIGFDGSWGRIKGLIRAQPGGNPIPGTGGVFELAWTGDISPPVGEPRGDDYGTSELALAGQPDAVALPGDLVYECGSPAAFTSPVGYHGSWGRLRGISYFPALGNHDVCEPGPGAPSWRAYFADQLANLPCTQQTPPCRPDLGYYDRDLDVNSDGRPDWYVLVLASDCQRVTGATGDTQTAACGAGSPQHEWLKAAMGRRHGGATSGQKCSIAIWHHERWGTTTFGDDPDTHQFILTLNHFHNDIILSGHAHALARLGAMTWDGHLAAGGNGQRQITAGVGGRSRLPFRVNPAREGTRYRSNTNYGIGWLQLRTSTHAAGYQVGTWAHEFRLVGTDGRGATVDQATAGCWA